MALTLFICGDVELNPGPKSTKSSYNFSKLSIIKAYNTHHNFDICFPETYLDSSYVDDDSRLNLKDFTLIRADNPHN